MQRLRAPKPLIALLAAATLLLPALSAPVSAAPAPARLADEVSHRLQTAAESDHLPVIIEGAGQGAGSARAQKAESSVRHQGGHVIGSSNLLGATAAELTPAQIRTLSTDPSLGRIHLDAVVNAASVGSADTSATATGLTPIVFQQTVGAPDAWKSGVTGEGVTVAVLDTGIDNNNAAFGARVKARVDLVDPAHPAQGDPAGHGTHVAGIVAAGRTAPSPGIAPDASLVSVRVLDAQGSSHLSTIMLGLEWVVTHKAALGIRVVVMALGAPAHTGYREDPLAAMAELAWRSGLVLVTAAGNAGPGAGTIQTPGIDPLVLTVGASDDHGTASTADDSLPTWSSAGPTPDGLAKPDLVAPGRKIVSVRVPGSTVDRQSPSHIEGPTTIRFSGTSEAAAVAGGAAALLLQQRPHLEPDQTKALLVAGARPIASASSTSQGAGELNVSRSLTHSTPHVERSRLRPADGLLRVLQAIGVRGGGDDDTQVEGDDQGTLVQFDQFRWDQFRWDQFRWDQFRWDQFRWDQLVLD